MKTFCKILTGSAATWLLTATAAQAQDDMARCSAISSPAARLACYDALSGHTLPAGPTAAQPPAATPVARPMAPAAPLPQASAPAAPAPVVTASAPSASSYEALRKRSNFDAVALEVEPLPHGLFRLHLADGTSYDTSQEGAHVAPGETIHIRRSPLGTTFADLPGQHPMPVRLVRPE